MTPDRGTTEQLDDEVADDGPEAGAALAELVGAALAVPCVDGVDRRYRDLDGAASTPATTSVAAKVAEFLPWYSSVHRGAGYKSRVATAAYEAARARVLEFAGRTPGGTGAAIGGGAGASGRVGDDVAVICRNATEAINHLAYRLPFGPGDVVVTTVVEHHANLLPWGRVAERRYVECSRDGTFGVDDVTEVLDAVTKEGRRPALLAVTGASNVTGWLPPVTAICEAAHERGVRVAVDAAQLAPHRPLPPGPDFVAFSGHKLYAPFGAGALVGPREAFVEGEPFLAGGGAVDLVDIDEVIWTEPPEREEAGSPNVVGAVAFDAAMAELQAIGWPAIMAHEARLAGRLRRGLAAIDGVTLLGPSPTPDRGDGGGDGEGLAVAAFTVEGMHHALVAARLSAEWAIGVRHGCFCAHPYLLRLLGLGPNAVAEARRQVLAGDRRHIPGAVRASCGLGTTDADVDALLAAVGELAAGGPAAVPYAQDPVTGDFFPDSDRLGWAPADRPAGSACARG